MKSSTNFFCPSSPLPKGQAPKQLGATYANYVAISGAYTGLIPNFNETRFNDLSCGGRIKVYVEKVLG